MAVTKEELAKAVKEVAVNGRLTCEDAHRLAERLEVSLLEIGQMADELEIKIKDCQLGCF